MGVVIREEYVCDSCEKPIEDGQRVHVGTLTLRKQGARGLGRTVRLLLHEGCAEGLTRNATSVASAKKG